jgi:hypothetical protein
MTGRRTVTVVAVTAVPPTVHGLAMFHVVRMGSPGQREGPNVLAGAVRLVVLYDDRYLRDRDVGRENPRRPRHLDDPPR